MKQPRDIVFCPDWQFDNLRNFRVTEKIVFPDFVLKITFGATGFFDPATQIHLVQIHGNECDIKIL